MEQIKRIFIIPDVHGRQFWREIRGITLQEFDKVIFLGDYGDPYPDEGISHQDALTELAQIIEFKKENMDKVVLLLGNHDLHYINSDYRCSRYSYDHKQEYAHFIFDNLGLFQVAYECQ